VVKSASLRTRVFIFITYVGIELAVYNSAYEQNLFHMGEN